MKNQVFSTYLNTCNQEKTLFFATKTEHVHGLSQNRVPEKDPPKHL